MLHKVTPRQVINRDIKKLSYKAIQISMITGGRSQFSLLTIAIAFVAIAVSLGICRRIIVWIEKDNSDFAIWATAGLLIDYGKANGNQWPSSWKDLEAFENQVGWRGPHNIDVSSLKAASNVDFSFDPSSIKVLECDSESFPVLVRQKSYRTPGDQHNGGSDRLRLYYQEELMRPISLRKYGVLP